MPFDTSTFESDFSHHDTVIDVRHLRQLFFTAIVEVPIEFFAFHHTPVFVGALFLKSALLLRSYQQLRAERRRAEATNITSKALEFDAINNMYDRGINTLALAICAGILQNAVIPYFLIRIIVSLYTKLKTNHEIRHQMYVINHDKYHGDIDKKAILIHSASSINPAALRALKLDQRAPEKAVIVIDDSHLNDADRTALNKNHSLLRTLYSTLYARSEVHFLLPYAPGAEKMYQPEGPLHANILSQLLLPDPALEVTTEDVKKHYYVDWTSNLSFPDDFIDQRWTDDHRLNTQKLFNRNNLRTHTISPVRDLSNFWNKERFNIPHVSIQTHDLATIYSKSFGKQSRDLFAFVLSLSSQQNWQRLTGDKEVPKVITDMAAIINGKDHDHFLKLCEIQRLSLKERDAYWSSTNKYRVFNTLSKIFPREMQLEQRSKPVSIQKTIADMQALLEKSAPSALPTQELLSSP